MSSPALASRAQHLGIAILVFGLAAVVTWLSWTGTPAQAFLFPRLISIFFLVLAAWNLSRAGLGLARNGVGFDVVLVRNIGPGLAIMLVYAFWAAKTFGFYTASTAAFFLILSIYDPAPHGQIVTWLKRIAITSVFMAVIFGLFNEVLQVQTPRGLVR